MLVVVEETCKLKCANDSPVALPMGKDDNSLCPSVSRHESSGIWTCKSSKLATARQLSTVIDCLSSRDLLWNP